MDLEAELRLERRARELLGRLAVAAAEADTLEEALQSALDDVCAHTKWPVGHALVRAADGGLESARLWHLDDPPRFARFRQVSEEMHFAPGIGLPGRVLATSEPHWIIDVALDPNFPRAQVIRDLSVRGAFGFPVHLRHQVFAVLEFFSPEPVPPDAPLLEVMVTLGTQLGRVVERIQADAALRRSEQRYRSLTQTAKDAIITADGEGRVVAWNRAATETFGWTEEEALGRSLTILIPERFRERHERGLARARAGGPTTVLGRTVELEGLRRDGSEFPLELSLSSWETAEAKFFTGILRDITERRLAAEQLQAIAVQLEQSEKVAVEANRAKSRFIAHMSHELRTPLNAILGFSHLLDRDPSLGREQRDHLAVVLRSGEHLLGLINDVLSLSKIEAGYHTMRVRDFHLDRLLGDALGLVEGHARGKGIALVLDVAKAPPLHGEPGKIRQVLVNLLANAVKFTDVGTVTLVARWADGRARFEVIDTGPGIPPRELARVFEPFVQIGEGGGAGGTGLGLAISRSLVELLGGELHVESELGRGTRFWFELPIPEGVGAFEESRPRGRVIGLVTDGSAPRILVVDDDADNRRLMAHLLEAVGFEVQSAADGAAGVAAWETFRPALVWMDVRMPVLDGLAATRRIRTREAETGRPRTVVLALTASAFEDDRPAVVAAGCDGVVLKPFDEAMIFDALSEHLGVRFRREEPPTAPAPSATGARTPEDLRRHGPEIVERLVIALRGGDDLAARAVLDTIAPRDPALAAELRAQVDRFQLDELLAWIEGA